MATPSTSQGIHEDSASSCRAPCSKKRLRERFARNGSLELTDRMAHRTTSSMSIRLPVAFAASGLLHALLLLIPIHGMPNAHEMSTNRRAADGIIHVSLSRREDISDKFSPHPPPGAPPATRVLPPAHLALTRQAELIEETIDDSLGYTDDMNIHGELVLELLVGRGGRPKSVRVIRSSMARSTEGAVVHRFFTARYRPGEVNGLPVESVILLSVTLSPNPAQ